MKGQYLIAPDGGAPDCYHENESDPGKAKKKAIFMAERENAPYSVFKKIGIAKPKKRPVDWLE